VDTKLFFADPDPTFQIVLDPDAVLNPAKWKKGKGKELNQYFKIT